jgi:DNA invertase Pin-like site-specific DNA recombinase
MEINRPPQLRDHHLRKIAFVYSRVSSREQAENSRGSLAAQEDQIRFALEDGYPMERIKFVDSDIGQSGTSMANRVGIGEVRDAVRAAKAGAIYLSSVDRIGRDEYDSLGLLKDCILRDVVIVEHGKHYNPRDLNELMPLRFKTFFAEIENLNRRGHIRRAIDAMVRRKEEFTIPPIGYVRSEDETSWVKDPDTRVREAIEAVFRIFAEEGTVRKTVRRLKAEGIKLPRRERAKAADATEDEI